MADSLAVDLAEMMESPMVQHLVTALGLSMAAKKALETEQMTVA